MVIISLDLVLGTVSANNYILNSHLLLLLKVLGGVLHGGPLNFCTEWGSCEKF